MSDQLYSVGKHGLVVKLTGAPDWKKWKQVRVVRKGKRDNGYGRLEYWNAKQIGYVDPRELTPTTMEAAGGFIGERKVHGRGYNHGR